MCDLFDIVSSVFLLFLMLPLGIAMLTLSVLLYKMIKDM